MKTADDILVEARTIIFTWLAPDNLADREALDRLLKVLDSEDAVRIARARGQAQLIEMSMATEEHASKVIPLSRYRRPNFR